MNNVSISQWLQIRFRIIWNYRCVKYNNHKILQESDLLAINSYHEAGHVVIGCLLGLSIDYTTCLVDPYRLTPGTATNVPSQAMLRRIQTDKDFHRLYNTLQVIQSMAGDLAVQKFTGKCYSFGAKTDKHNQYRLAREIGEDSYFLQQLTDRVREVLDRTDYWEAVIRVAEALKTKHRIEGNEVKELVARSVHNMPTNDAYQYISNERLWEALRYGYLPVGFEHT